LKSLLFQDIIFTSGGTESNNIVFHSVLAHYQSLKFKPHFITCAIEHDSVLQPLLKLAEDDLIEITVCKPTNGKVLVDELVSAIKINTALVSLMLANNETGVLQVDIVILLICFSFIASKGSCASH
jgi:selenocysteine lyase